MIVVVPIGSQRAPISMVLVTLEIIRVWEGFRIVQGCDWIYLDNVAAQTDHLGPRLDQFLFLAFWTLYGAGLGALHGARRMAQDLGPCMGLYLLTKDLTETAAMAASISVPTNSFHDPLDRQ